MKRALTIILASAMALPGCTLAWWGPSEQEQGYSAERERWELPLGVAFMPVAATLDLACSLGLTMIFVVANPINWALIAASAEPIGPGFGMMFFTSTALTLANPDCNLDWSHAHQDVVFLDWHFADDDAEKDRRKVDGD